MHITHDILVPGNSFSFAGGFFGFSSIVLVNVQGYPPVLFDTGHHCTRPMLLEALRQRDLSPEDIKTVFLSHLHFDHINNIDLFPSAQFHIGEAEWRYAQAPAQDDVFCSIAMNAYLESRNLTLIQSDAGELYPGLSFRHAPGHTPGGYLLHFVNPAGKRIVLAGDACKTYRELATCTVANAFDPLDRSAQTLEWIAGNADIVVPGHFPELRRTSGGWIWDTASMLGLISR